MRALQTDDVKNTQKITKLEEAITSPPSREEIWTHSNL